MKSFKIRRFIAADPTTVWSVLTDVETLLRGDFGILSLEGELADQSKIKLTAEISPKQTFPLTVAEFTPPKRMVWRGSLPLGLFTGIRQFNLAEVHDGTDFNMREDFSGMLSRTITWAMPDLHPSFEQFADALKAEAEARGNASA